MTKERTTIIILKEHVPTKCSTYSTIEIIGKLSKEQKKQLTKRLYPNGLYKLVV